MTAVSRHYVLAAGGTGGHLIPAFALASELEARGHHVALITDSRGATIPGKPDFLPAHILPEGRIAGKNPLGWLRGAKGVWEGRSMALRLFETFEPSAVVGFGGYPALPTMLAARSVKIDLSKFTLVAATTENPFFSVISPLLSRSLLNPFSPSFRLFERGGLEKGTQALVTRGAGLGGALSAQ